MFKGTHTENHVKDVVFNFTGFGPFLNIINNPTMELVATLQKLKENPNNEFTIGDVRWLEVSTDAVNEYLEEIHKKLEQKVSENKEVRQVLIHMGVYGGSTKIHLEIHGYNRADFRGPDVKGNQPQNEKINKKFPLEHYFRTAFPVEKICKELENNHKVRISDDPGRYVCNYIFYRSMCEGYSRDIPCIFIHVPNFSEVKKEDQEAFIQDFMKVARKLLLEEAQHEVKV